MDRENVVKEVLKATNTSIDSIKALESVNTDKQFSLALLEQEKAYQELSVKVKGVIANERIDVKNEGLIPKVVLWGATKAKTVVDNSPSRLAEILIHGANMGIINLTKAQNTLEAGVDATLLNELNTKYTHTIDAMKVYL